MTATMVTGDITPPIFVDLQGFVVNEQFVTKEMAILANGRDLTHLSRADIVESADEEREVAGLYVEYWHAKQIVRDAIYRASRDLESNAAVTIYVKGREKKKWLTDIAGKVAEQRDLTIETIDDDYVDIGPLRTLASTRVYHCGYHCGYHTKNCALKNVCKLHN
ncbi:hypothetical protein EAG_07063 [Camponotus floridanus]|uniref:Uncharacterized protein n=1 Tax=Camponotus floridanus TaxID=104421 RepID=E2AK85_CAMFO|nr:hypothetical protein EAG_07063 [Camponotus floridanus]